MRCIVFTIICFLSATLLARTSTLYQQIADEVFQSLDAADTTRDIRPLFLSYAATLEADGWLKKREFMNEKITPRLDKLKTQVSEEMFKKTKHLFDEIKEKSKNEDLHDQLDPLMSDAVKKIMVNHPEMSDFTAIAARIIGKVHRHRWWHQRKRALNAGFTYIEDRVKNGVISTEEAAMLAAFCIHHRCKKSPYKQTSMLVAAYELVFLERLFGGLFNFTLKLLMLPVYTSITVVKVLL